MGSELKTYAGILVPIIPFYAILSIVDDVFIVEINVISIERL